MPIDPDQVVYVIRDDAVQDLQGWGLALGGGVLCLGILLAVVFYVAIVKPRLDAQAETLSQIGHDLLGALRATRREDVEDLTAALEDRDRQIEGLAARIHQLEILVGRVVGRLGTVLVLIVILSGCLAATDLDLEPSKTCGFAPADRETTYRAWGRIRELRLVGHCPVICDAKLAQCTFQRADGKLVPALCNGHSSCELL